MEFLVSEFLASDLILWRICQEKHRNTAFSGVGGLYVSGRWHPKGYKVVYTAESLALATLEVFVHIESARIPLITIRAHIPKGVGIEKVNIQNLPSNWQEVDAYPKLQKIGENWLTNGNTPILKFPSAIVPVEFNYLINPEHRDFKLNLEPPMSFKFDQRMWKSLPSEYRNFDVNEVY